MDERYVVREGFDQMDFARVHSWLTASYWSPGVAREAVERAARHSTLVIGAFTEEGLQVAYMRVVSDCTRFAYLADVIVDEAHRGHGIARAMVRHAHEHPELEAVLMWSLLTNDAHGVYAPLGYRPITAPERWMVRHPEAGPPKPDDADGLDEMPHRPDPA
jgi:GNAT superfamily N-acetyltransferase